jgi:hypothetical protein
MAGMIGETPEMLVLHAHLWVCCRSHENPGGFYSLSRIAIPVKDSRPALIGKVSQSAIDCKNKK